MSRFTDFTADGAAYTRDDGVHVIPLSCLRN